jgi:L-fucose mutarotase/ribose pyranase (RbsD/FucU family)
VRYRSALLLCVLTCFAAEKTVPAAASSNAGWNRMLLDRIPLYGHRNWIVIADSAYPAQSAAGIETIVSNGDHVQVLEQVLAALSASRHVRAIIYTDEELKFIDEKDAPGVSAYRQQITRLLHNRAVKSLPHEQIIAKPKHFAFSSSRPISLFPIRQCFCSWIAPIGAQMLNGGFERQWPSSIIRSSRHILR